MTKIQYLILSTAHQLLKHHLQGLKNSSIGFCTNLDVSLEKKACELILSSGVCLEDECPFCDKDETEGKAEKAIDFISNFLTCNERVEDNLEYASFDIAMLISNQFSSSKDLQMFLSDLESDVLAINARA
jgi:hypothetical protein